MHKDPWDWTNLASDPEYDSVEKRLQKDLPQTDAPDIEYFAYGINKAQEGFSSHSGSDTGKITEELDKK